ncbi:hypothetical protein PPL_03370 [Heterostelium album PN500]|uniref:Mitochondrial import inner membrane translocase subunit TIM23 n=1 Tax=Heterostelium pallidum (strain ATCC 26659 / Pp 5 / PN500) TaxID=670386 RepID=D3B4P5_HETP5|nr:hypothetical protein PPL_03370 [Heterostelium album PN500]EFA84293.1 hypothetical protein PPL_03370 [Heterostelium album PN500]|eukprot:XP_020436409.1 hypothetical protein PPL_03370 [Heterostelium album PN500]
MSGEFVNEEYMGTEAPKGVEFSALNEAEGNYAFIQNTGIAYLGGVFVGTTAGVLQGSQSATQYTGFKPRLNVMLNYTGKSAATCANTAASVVLSYGVVKLLLSKSTGYDEDSVFCSVAAGAAVGSVYKAPGGFAKSAIGGTIGGLLGYLNVLGRSRHPQWK